MECALIKRVHHTSFTVADMDRSVHFYRDLLGYEFINEQGGKLPYLAEITSFAEADLRVVFLRPTPETDTFLELIQYRWPVGAPADVRTCNPGSAHICMIVDGIHGEYERLRAAGVKFRSAPVAITAGRNKGGFSVYFEDPDGITLEFIQPAPQA